MTGYRDPKDPLAIPKAIRLRERANQLKAKADALLREADKLLAEAQQLEAEPSIPTNKGGKDFRQTDL